MENINKNRISKRLVSGLGMLAILALGVSVMPETSSAQYYNNYNSYYNSGYGSYGAYTPYSSYGAPAAQPAATIQEPVTPAPVATPVVYSNASNGVKVAKKAAPKKVASKPLDNSGSLAANAVFGSNSFMPSGIIQWTAFAILILLVVLLARKAFGADKNYHSTPMKHA